ncbi:hypothetical protein NL108_006929 [Boleophthalmus pectinirostris]|nr:hypothetical protein NL108_006929 [Boleophthalmus pectinirostris]
MLPEWYKQIPETIPVYVLSHGWGWTKTGPKYGPGFSAPKFNCTSQSKSDYRLIINNVDGVDSAVYYCYTWDDSAKEYVFGQGTKLIVNDVAPAPVLTVLPPSLTQLQSSRVSLLCVSHQRGPFAQVTWLVDGTPVNSGVWSSSAVQQPDQSFYMSSSLSINTTDWGTHKVYTCRVSVGTHSSERHISKCQCGEKSE